MGPRVVLACLVLWVASARAEVPWAQGVSEDKQSAAAALAAEADKRVAVGDAMGAIAKYEAALELWDHPVYRLRLALQHIKVDHLVEASDELEHALRYDAAPFSPDEHAQALDYYRLVQARLGTLVASCSRPGLAVSLDGRPWFTCPGVQKRRLVAGDHAVRASLEGYEPQEQLVHVDGNGTVQMNLGEASDEEAFAFRHRFATWLPWTVLGTGVALGVTGGLLYANGSDRIHEYDQAVAINCAVSGCTEEDLGGLRELRDSGDRRVRLGVFGIATGLVTLTTGIVLQLLNEPIRYRVGVAPTAGGATAMAGWTF